MPFLSSADCFSKSSFSKKYFSKMNSVNQFGTRSGPTCFLGPDLGSNCLQRLLADEISRQIAFLSSTDFFRDQDFQKILSGK